MIPDLQAQLGEAAAAIPAIPGTRMKRFLYPEHGVTLLGIKEVVAIFLTSEDSPALLLRRTGLASEVFQLRVGMSKEEFEQILGADHLFGTIDAVMAGNDNPDSLYRFYHEVGLAVKFRGGKVVELVVAPLG
jgi:hypothetical protein